MSVFLLIKLFFFTFLCCCDVMSAAWHPDSGYASWLPVQVSFEPALLNRGLSDPASTNRGERRLIRQQKGLIRQQKGRIRQKKGLIRQKTGLIRRVLATFQSGQKQHLFENRRKNGPQVIRDWHRGTRITYNVPFWLKPLLARVLFLSTLSLARKNAKATENRPNPATPFVATPFGHCQPMLELESLLLLLLVLLLLLLLMVLLLVLVVLLALPGLPSTPAAAAAAPGVPSAAAGVPGAAPAVASTAPGVPDAGVPATAPAGASTAAGVAPAGASAAAGGAAGGTAAASALGAPAATPGLPGASGLDRRGRRIRFCSARKRFCLCRL